MGLMDFFRRTPKEETRAVGSGFTSQVMHARAAYVTGRSGIAEMTALVQACVSLWEGGLSVADVEGTALLSPQVLALTARALALRGEAVFLIREDRLVPCSDWDVSTVDTAPRAYRLSIPDAGGGRTRTALAGEVLHFRVGCDVGSPWIGQPPLRRASLTAEMLHSVEAALMETFRDGPLGSMIVPFPESPQTDLEHIGRGFRGRRGSVLLRESTHVTAAGGPTPAQDWRPQHVSPDLERSQSSETLQAARSSIAMAFGVLPAALNEAATGPLVREAQRHLAQWMLAPITRTMGQETSEKLGTEVSLDVMRPLQAFDAGGRARAAAGIIEALARAQEAGVDPAQAMRLVDWD